MRRRTAVFVDFDNLFGTAYATDPALAEWFAQEPSEWMERLETFGLSGERRYFTVRRCYLNPAGVIKSPVDGDRVFFTRYRMAFVLAGFEVIECPPLSRAMKNAADVRMVIDVMDHLNSPSPAQEVIVASADSDFVPLVSRLRSLDIRTMILSSGSASRSYAELADETVDGQLFADLVANQRARTPAASTQLTESDREMLSAHLSEFRVLVAETLRQSTGAVNLAFLGAEAHRRFGPVIKSTRWFGEGTMQRAIGSEFHVLGDWIYDPERVAEESLPRPGEAAASAGRSGPYGVELPTCTPDTWKAIFAAISEYLAQEEFHLSRASMFIRDRLHGGPHQVSRATATWAAFTLRLSGLDLSTVAHHSPEVVADAILAAVGRYALSRHGTMTEPMYHEFAGLLGVDNPAPFAGQTFERLDEVEADGPAE